MKTTLVTIRVTQDELQSLRDVAQAKGFANVSDYARKRLGLNRKRQPVGAPRTAELKDTRR